MMRITKYVLADILRNKTLLVYTLLLFLLSFSVFSLEDNPTKGVLSILNLLLIIVPLISSIFTTIYIYNSSEFIELLVSQPVKRSSIWMSLYIGLASSLSLAFIIGAGIITLIYQPDSTGVFLILSGVLLSLTFCSIAMLTSVYNRDKAKGIGASILTWLYFSLLFDGILVFLLFQFSDYPIEKAMMTLSMLNPIDLARILILLKLDVSALMGYTGALFRSFFGNAFGQTISFLVLAIWFLLPFLISLRKFKHKDL